MISENQNYMDILNRIIENKDKMPKHIYIEKLKELRSSLINKMYNNFLQREKEEKIIEWVEKIINP